MRRLFALTMSGLILIFTVSAKADIKTGIDAYNKQDYSTAFDEFMRLAKEGDAGAQLQLGLMYDNGLGKTKAYDKAFYWYKRSANNGNAHAQFNVAEMLVLGQGTKKNQQQARKWYIRAAESGFAEAQYKLGLELSQGRPEQQDVIEACKWLSLAARQPVKGATIANSALEKLKTRMTAEKIIEAEKRADRWEQLFSEKQQNLQLKI